MSYDVFTKDGKPAGRLTVTRKGPRTVFEFQSDTDPGVSRLVLISGAAPHSLGIPAQRAGGLYLQKTMTKLDLDGMEIGDGLTALLIPADEDFSALTGVKAPEVVPSSAPETADTSPENREESREADPSAPEENTSEACAPEENTSEACVPEESVANAAQPDLDAPASEPEEKPESAARGREDAGDVWRSEPEPWKYFTDDALRQSASRCSGALVRDTEDGVILAFPWTPASPFPMLEIFKLCSSINIDGAEYIAYRLKNGEPV